MIVQHDYAYEQEKGQTSLLDTIAAVWWNPITPKKPLMREIPKTELSPDNGCIIDTKWKVGPLSYHSCASEIGNEAIVNDAPMPEIVIYDHVGFRGAYARTNLSFLFLGDFWNNRISSLIIVSGVWRFYRDDYYKGDHWDLGPGFYECFFKDRGPDDVVSSFQAMQLT